MAESTRGDWENALVESWVRLLQYAFTFAKGEHINRMLLIPVSRYDSRGIDPYSEVWGAIGHIYGHLPGLHELGVVDPVLMKAEAKRAAVEQLEAELREKPLGEVMRQRRSDK